MSKMASEACGVSCVCDYVSPPEAPQEAFLGSLACPEVGARAFAPARSALVARELHSESPERAPIVARPIEVSFGTDLSAAGRRGADWRRLLRARRCLSEDRARRLENRSGRG